MKVADKVSHRILLFIHTLGLSCLGGAIFLELLVFMDILRRGYFMAVENNPLILAFETFLTLFALAYFIYLYHQLIRSLKRTV
ncbi:MAG: hypothetical protein N3F10_03940 [Candidatus Bathyarchaeota archaeon]|nr:hypothetical protein [Candidatus Bathyarchaeota archaeon]MCX8177431.1 hypothetical protein [Candidatus Bathyarchaeota archaeon]MDW8194436.1 hypothetical protein [Nitrososphaerota archaeon]